MYNKKELAPQDIAFIENNAKSGAQKICGMSRCPFHFLNCGHSNVENINYPALGSLVSCPLAEYHIQPAPDANDPQHWINHTYEEMNPSENELFALCAKCSKSHVHMENGEMAVTRTDLRACMDCPVKAVIDTQEECAAEGAMS